MTATLMLLVVTAYTPLDNPKQNGYACYGKPAIDCAYPMGTAACRRDLWGARIILPAEAVAMGLPTSVLCTGGGGTRVQVDVSILRGDTVEQIAADVKLAFAWGRRARQVQVVWPGGVPLPVATPAPRQPQRNVLTHRDHLLTARQELRTQPAPLLGRSVNNARKTLYS